MDNVLNCSGHRLQIPNIVDSDGIYVTDDKGNKYMDLESGVWCMSLGHRNPRINAMMKNQIDSVVHAGFCYSSEVLQRSAETVLSITDLRDGKCVFLCSGSEAIELARQIAKHITKKKVSMTLHDSYLGSYSSVIDRSNHWFIFNWEKCQHCPDLDACNRNCEELQKIPKDISDFIFEPGSSSGFVRFPPVSLIKNIVDIVRSNGGKIIINEVTTGIGRTGKWFGYQHYPIRPDMVAIGKGVGNGYPVSIALLDNETADQAEKTGFKYYQSHQNDPLGAAIANEVIHTIREEGLISKAETKGKVFLQKLNGLKDGKNIVDVRGRGLMFGVDLGSVEVGDWIYAELLKKGYIVCNRKALFRIDPPLIISEDEFNQFILDFQSILTSI